MVRFRTPTRRSPASRGLSTGKSGLIGDIHKWQRLCGEPGNNLEARMVWFLERGESRLVCEIRRIDNSDTYEFELGPEGQPAETVQFASPSQLIDAYLRRQSALQADGWRPRAADVPLFGW
jgi:hypothetical protein